MAHHCPFHCSNCCKTQFYLMTLLRCVLGCVFKLNIHLPCCLVTLSFSFLVLSSIILWNHFQSLVSLSPPLKLSTCWLHHTTFCVIKIWDLVTCPFIFHDMPVVSLNCLFTVNFFTINLGLFTSIWCSYILLLSFCICTAFTGTQVFHIFCHFFITVTESSCMGYSSLLCFLVNSP